MYLCMYVVVVYWYGGASLCLREQNDLTELFDCVSGALTGLFDWARGALTGSVIFEQQTFVAAVTT